MVVFVFLSFGSHKVLSTLCSFPEEHTVTKQVLIKNVKEKTGTHFDVEKYTTTGRDKRQFVRSHSLPELHIGD